MGDILKFDYYYGIEAEQFSFYRVPRLLVKDKRFKGLSSDAKLLYGLMLDRMALSMKNGWFDNENRAYIHYTIDTIMEDLGCAKEKATKVLAELDNKKGIGLIEKKRQGLGKPDIIYVKNFATLEIKEETFETEKESFDEEKEMPSETKKETFIEEENPVNTNNFKEVEKSKFKKSENRNSRVSETELPEVRKSKFKSFENQTSRVSEIEPQEVGKSNPNYNYINYNNYSYNNHNHIDIESNQSELIEDKDKMDLMDNTHAYIQLIKDNIEYDYFMQYGERKKKTLYDELFEVICDVVCVPRKAVRVGKEDYPYQLVKAKFLKLNSQHLEYVIECMQNTGTKIGNMKAYMITSLYNAPNTLNHYYQQEVKQDAFGGL